MSKLKRFLDRREAGITKKEQANKEDQGQEMAKVTKTIINPNIGFIVVEEEVEKEPESLDLSDEEFWDISNSFNKQIKQSADSAESILQKILEQYTPLKIKQFAARYEELNK